MQIRFYGCLNDFLNRAERSIGIEHTISGKQTIKDAIEAKGIPHTEVAFILVNSIPVGFDHIVKKDDYVSVYPPFENSYIVPDPMLYAPPSMPVKFVADSHLGRLARHLRMLGFDCIYAPDIADTEILRLAKEDNRVVLTRDIGILKNRKAKYGYFIRSTHPKKQLQEVVWRYDLKSNISPFLRCLDCNGLIHPIDKKKITGSIPSKVSLYYDRFFRCSTCGKIYWEGSHFVSMKNFIDSLI